MKRLPVWCLVLVSVFVACPRGRATPATDEAAVTTLYLEWFTITHCFGSCSTAKSLQSRDSEILLARVSESDLLYFLLSKKGGKGRFDSKNVRVLVPAQKEHPEYQVDGEGVVRTGKTEYLLTPSAFLRLSELLGAQTPGFVRYRKEKPTLAPSSNVIL